jgi:hypothetical protein
VRLQRLVLHAGTAEEAFTLELHPRLTVVTGAGRLEREGLVNEILGALGSSRPGVHLELTDDRDRSLAVFRPAAARHRVIDIDRGVDVTGEFEQDGQIDLLAAAGIPTDRMRRLLCVTGADLSSEAHHDEHVRRLAQVHQDQLWDAAGALRDVEQELASCAGEASAPVDAELVHLIESRHAAVQQAAERLENVRATAFTLAAVFALVAVVAGWVVAPMFAVPFIAAAVGATGLSLLRWRQVRRAEAAEDAVLRSAGMSSYLTFQLHRVDGLVSSQEERRLLVELSEIHSEALGCWQALAGEVDVEWAWNHRSEIEAARPTLRGSRRDREATLAAALSDRLDSLATTARLRPPVLLDEPFGPVDDIELRELISLVLDATEDLQLVLLTEDPRIAEWARLEQLGGTICHLELNPSDGTRGDRPRDRHRSLAA